MQEDFRRDDPGARPAGVTAIAAFFMFGATMSCIAAVSLSIPGSPLDFLWRVNPTGHEGLTAIGTPAIFLMLVVSIACFLVSRGLWLGRTWSRWGAITILAVNAVADVFEALARREWTPMIGPPIAAALAGYLLTARVRRFFTVRPSLAIRS
jgi:hypothetical protein